jgi:hypothetical protein
VTEYRASLDAVVSFGNGGDLTVRGFRIDLPARDVDDAEIAALFIASLGLLMTDSVELSNTRVFAEAHKGTRGGPSDHRSAPATTTGRLVELSHVIRAGLTTYPGLPGPVITPHLTRQASRQHYAPGTEFAIDKLTLVGNTGTYLDAPYHRYPDGADLSAIRLEQTVDLPAVVVRMATAPPSCSTPATTPGSARRPTQKTGTSSPGPAPAGLSTTVQHSSASTRSTSTTSPTPNGPPTRCRSLLASPSSST